MHFVVWKYALILIGFGILLSVGLARIIEPNFLVYKTAKFSRSDLVIFGGASFVLGMVFGHTFPWVHIIRDVLS